MNEQQDQRGKARGHDEVKRGAERKWSTTRGDGVDTSSLKCHERSALETKITLHLHSTSSRHERPPRRLKN